MNTIISRLVGTFLLILITGTTGCIDGTTEIREIRSNPDKYLGSECLVKGYVTRTLDVPFTSKDYFKINDGTDEIWIFTDRGIPPENVRVKVKGVFERAISVLSIEIGYRIRLREIEFLD